MDQKEINRLLLHINDSKMKDTLKTDLLKNLIEYSEKTNIKYILDSNAQKIKNNEELRILENKIEVKTQMLNMIEV